MFLSQVHDWQGDAAVKQILVFIDENRMHQFDVAYAAKVAVEGVSHANDSSMGAIAKLRAVKNGSGEWSAVVRCGFSGVKLYETYLPFAAHEAALVDAYNNFMKFWIVENFNPVIAELCNAK